jgi:dTMP kinase
MNGEKPIYIVCEGCDGCGKSTTVKSLANRFTRVKLMQDPGISTDPEFKKWRDIRMFVKNEDMSDDTETLMFMALKAELVYHAKQYLDEGYSVIQDRGTLSSYIYQGKLKGQTECVKMLDKYVNKHKPKYTFVLMASFDVLTARLEQRLGTDNPNMDKFKSNTNFRKKIYDYYIEYLNENIDKDKTLYVIDANHSTEKIVDQMIRIIND